MGRIDKQKRILLIDDDVSLLKILSMQLTYNGFRVDTTQTGNEGFELATKNEYDAIVLDMKLPDRSGLSVCHDLRQNGILTPILVLSGNTDKKIVIDGLRTGADDYLEKPFYKAELLERLNALIRRNQRSFTSSIHTYGDITLDLQNHSIHAGTLSLKLTAIEIAVMRCLMQQAPKTVDRQELFERVWGISDEHTSNRLDVYIRRLRRKLMQLNTELTITMVYGQGYRLK